MCVMMHSVKRADVSLSSIPLRLPFKKMCWLFPVCVPINSTSPELQFRRAVCRVNWSRGLSNWFSNHILWKFMTFFFLFALATQPQWSSTPTTNSLRCSFIFLKLNFGFIFLILLFLSELKIEFFLCCASTVDAHAAVMEHVHKWH